MWFNKHISLQLQIELENIYMFMFWESLLVKDQDKLFTNVGIRDNYCLWTLLMKTRMNNWQNSDLKT